MALTNILFLAVVVISGAWLLFVSAQEMNELKPEDRATGAQFMFGTAPEAGRQVYRRMIKRGLKVAVVWMVAGIFSAVVAHAMK